MLSSIWRLKPSTPSAPGSSAKRVLGPWQLIALGVGTSLGAGLFAITGIAAGQYAGPAVALSFLFAALASAFVALSYAELASMFPNAAGSAYSYAYAGLGEGIAWGIGWCLFIAYLVTLSLVAGSWSSYLTSLLAEWGIVLDPRIVASTGTLVTMPDGSHARAFINLPAIIAIFAMTALHLGGVRESSKVNTLLVGLKVAMVTVFIIACLPHVDLRNYHPYLPENTGQFGQFGWSGILSGASLVFAAYLGFDIVSSAARDTREPRKNLPIGILGTLGVCACIYVTFSAVLVGVVNFHQLAHDASPAATAMNAIHMPVLAQIVKLGILIGFFAVLYGVLFGLSRSIMTMAEDGLIPPVFSRTTRNGAPWAALIGLAITSSMLGAVLSINALGNMVSLGTLLAFIVVCIAVLILRYRRPQAERPFRMPGGPWCIPLLGILSCLAVLSGMDLMTWLRFGVALALGAAIYFLYGIRHSKLACKGSPQPFEPF
ncbi:amino acid permease [Oecophyllibacter saccharovorans]|uniref:APC family permease n=1 Tax=Oecophyllibacter saccharovorans TaxID=2558360 RepID=UPI001143E7F8|nr:amino acid permease [Oecophyllibacter saccharovorans]QDH15389.1 amino acid permease [Oecophyllibacter saccharovorans]